MTKIDINRADVETLAQLNGIGAKLAARVITYRETVHPFEETIELTAVPGISERMVRALADEIMVEPVSAMEESAGPPQAEDASAEVTVAALPEASPIADGERSVVSDPPATTGIGDLREEAISAEEVENDAPDEVDFILLPEEGDETEAEVEKVGAAPAQEGPEAPPGADDDQTEPIAAETPAEAPVREEEAAVALAPPRRGCLNTSLIALLGAVMGAALTLLLLFALNGTLDFATPSQVAGLRGQIEAQDEAQGGLGEEVAVLSTRLGAATSAEATTAAGLEETANRLERDLAGLERQLGADVATLEAETVGLADRIDALSDAAENFDVFLDGMRDLLVELRGLPPLPTATTTPAVSATATITGTIPAVTPTGEGTPATDQTPTPTPFVTRTPRPTSTPLVSSTPTSVNIP